MFTVTTVLSACKRTSELYSVFGWLTAVMIHMTPFFANGNTIFFDGKVIFVFDFDAAFFIQINKRYDVLTLAVFIFIDRHCIMGRIQEQLCNIEVRKERFHSETCFQKSMGIMFRSRI